MVWLHGDPKITLMNRFLCRAILFRMQLVHGVSTDDSQMQTNSWLDNSRLVNSLQISRRKKEEDALIRQRLHAYNQDGLTL